MVFCLYAGKLGGYPNKQNIEAYISFSEDIPNFVDLTESSLSKIYNTYSYFLYKSLLLPKIMTNL